MSIDPATNRAVPAELSTIELRDVTSREVGGSAEIGGVDALVATASAGKIPTMDPADSPPLSSLTASDITLGVEKATASPLSLVSASKEAPKISLSVAKVGAESIKEGKIHMSVEPEDKKAMSAKIKKMPEHSDFLEKLEHFLRQFTASNPGLEALMTQARIHH